VCDHTGLANRAPCSTPPLGLVVPSLFLLLILGRSKVLSKTLCVRGPFPSLPPLSYDLFRNHGWADGG